MTPMTSPNDPVFFLHHCFVDKIWADWQAVQLVQKPEAAPHYAPERDGPPGHNLGDQLKPWVRKVQDVIDISNLGYEYESGPMLMLATADAIRGWVRSPFWAD